MAWAPELEVLDQLLGGDMSLFAIKHVLHQDLKQRFTLLA